jgi:hypothetical protein
MKKRRTFDAQGRPIVEIESDTGTFRQEIDTARVRAMRGDELSLEATRPMRRPHFAPYGPEGDGAPAATRRRNGLDYLRALSEEIKKRRRSREPGE